MSVKRSKSANPRMGMDPAWLKQLKKDYSSMFDANPSRITKLCVMDSFKKIQ